MRRYLTILALAAAIFGQTALAADPPKAAAQPPAGSAVAIFAGGCFWCMEPPYDKLDGVISTTSGYTGGMRANPTYKEVSAGTSGHIEVVQVVYDPRKVTYERLLEVFWRNIDPEDGGGQFCDRGPQYRSAIFPLDDAQKAAAERSKASLQSSGRLKKPVATEIISAKPFYPAEDYHQDYYQKNPIRYRYYRTSCGRDARLREVWGPES